MNLEKQTAISNLRAVVDNLSNFLTKDLYNGKLITFAELKESVDPRDYKFIDWLCSAKPADVGVKTPHYGIEEPTEELSFHTIERERIIKKPDGSTKKYQEKNYLPKEVSEHWSQMYDRCLEDTGKELFLVSGYRSPAYQALLMCYYLSRRWEDQAGVFKLVALPGYSQHGLLSQTALDVDTPQRITDTDHPEDFDKTEQFQWLIKNAKGFSFFLSYPKTNGEGMDYEPWHWQYKG